MHALGFSPGVGRVRMVGMSFQIDIPPPVKVLLVDDGQVEAVLFRNIFDRSPALHLMHVAKDGREAMEFMRRQGPFRNMPQPDLVLLDIYMPHKDGFEVLRDMRSDPVLCRIPVIMLTSSGRGEDVNRAYEEGANTFITKPSDVDGLKKTIRLFADYWSETAQLPSTSRIAASSPSPGSSPLRSHGFRIDSLRGCWDTLPPIAAMGSARGA